MKSGAVDLLTEPLVAVGAAPIPEVVVTVGVSAPTTWKKVSGRVIAPPGSPLPNGIRVAVTGLPYPLFLLSDRHNNPKQ